MNVKAQQRVMVLNRVERGELNDGLGDVLVLAATRPRPPDVSRGG